MKATVAFQALAALKAVTDGGSRLTDPALWEQCMRAFSKLELELMLEGLAVPVEQEKEAA